MRDYTMIRISKSKWEKELRDNLKFAINVMIDLDTPSGGTHEEIFQATRKWTDLQSKLNDSRWEFEDSTVFHYCIALSPDSLALLDKAVITAYEQSIIRATSIVDDYVRNEAIAKRQYEKAKTLRMLHDCENAETFAYAETESLNCAVLAAAKKGGWGSLKNNSDA